MEGEEAVLEDIKTRRGPDTVNWLLLLILGAGSRDAFTFVVGDKGI